MGGWWLWWIIKINQNESRIFINQTQLFSQNIKIMVGMTSNYNFIQMKCWFYLEFTLLIRIMNSMCIIYDYISRTTSTKSHHSKCIVVTLDCNSRTEGTDNKTLSSSKNYLHRLSWWYLSKRRRRCRKCIIKLMNAITCTCTGTYECILRTSVARNKTGNHHFIVLKGNTDDFEKDKLLFEI